MLIYTIYIVYTTFYFESVLYSIILKNQNIFHLKHVTLFIQFQYIMYKL